MRGTKSVRFLDNKTKTSNTNNTQQDENSNMNTNTDQSMVTNKKDKKTINQTIDNSQDQQHKLSVLEVEQYLRRAGSPQPESTHNHNF